MFHEKKYKKEIRNLLCFIVALIITINFKDLFCWDKYFNTPIVQFSVTSSFDKIAVITNFSTDNNGNNILDPWENKLHIFNRNGVKISEYNPSPIPIFWTIIPNESDNVLMMTGFFPVPVSYIFYNFTSQSITGDKISGSFYTMISDNGRYILSIDKSGPVMPSLVLYDFLEKRQIVSRYAGPNSTLSGTSLLLNKGEYLLMFDTSEDISSGKKIQDPNSVKLKLNRIVNGNLNLVWEKQGIYYEK